MTSKEEYTGLIARVRSIDSDAADYMRGDEVRRQATFVECTLLDCAFMWRKTPQGKEYWDKINDQL